MRRLFEVRVLFRRLTRGETLATDLGFWSFEEIRAKSVQVERRILDFIERVEPDF